MDDASRRLRVDVRADRQEYRPRQDVNVSVAVTDARGRPRATEVTLWAMDHGLLSLTEYKAPDVARAIYADKALQVLTQDNRSRLIGRYAMLPASTGQDQGQQGAGGGGRGGAAFRSSLVGGIPATAPFDAIAESVVVSSAAIEEPQDEGRFLAFTDPIPAGFDAVDALLSTTATDLAARATQQASASDRFAWWRRGGFDHVEKHDDRMVAYATRLSTGRHEISYLVRATTAGTFTAQGAWGEAMYAPEITGRSAAVVLDVSR